TLPDSLVLKILKTPRLFQLYGCPVLSDFLEPLKRSHTYCLFEALATSPKEIASIHAALFAI
uniref:hypothetical protein n=1 Tax=Hassallia byssoidea TaxID=482630 RepID=UPI001F34FF41